LAHPVLCSNELSIVQVVFFYSADTHRQTHKVTNSTDHSTHTSTTAGVGKYMMRVLLRPNFTGNYFITSS